MYARNNDKLEIYITKLDQADQMFQAFNDR